MKKRLLSLLVLTVVIILAVAPAAMADHCRKCSISQRCAIAVTGGKPACDDSTGVCILTGTTCTGPHPVIEEPLASEFTVASVVRTDQRQQPADATRVASLATVPSTR
jgi:hypothetical protein